MSDATDPWATLSGAMDVLGASGPDVAAIVLRVARVAAEVLRARGVPDAGAVVTELARGCFRPLGDAFADVHERGRRAGFADVRALVDALRTHNGAALEALGAAPPDLPAATAALGRTGAALARGAIAEALPPTDPRKAR